MLASIALMTAIKENAITIDGFKEPELRSSSAEGLRSALIHRPRISWTCRWLTGSWLATQIGPADVTGGNCGCARRWIER